MNDDISRIAEQIRSLAASIERTLQETYAITNFRLVVDNDPRWCVLLTCTDTLTGRRPMGMHGDLSSALAELTADLTPKRDAAAKLREEAERLLQKAAAAEAS